MSTLGATAFVVATTAAAAAVEVEIEDEPCLSAIPQHVYRIDDPGKFATESWYFELVVHDAKLRNWKPNALQLQLFAGDRVVKTTTVSEQGLTSLRQRNYFPPPFAPKAALTRHFSIADEVFTLPLRFSERRADAVDRVRVTLTLQLDEATVTRSLLVPVERFEQKTKLIFPFEGTGIVTQGRFNDGGHAHRETLFAIDVMALTPTYAPMTSERESNETVAGWGKEILAPAGGIVIYSRNDVPTNPLYKPDERVYSALPEPVWAIGGNCVVIDHGNGEFSGLMHLQPGSVMVEKDDVVEQGDVIGKLGNSGDSYMPHLHYQLTTGPLIFASDGLPFRFDNLPNVVFTRGTYFTAK